MRYLREAMAVPSASAQFGTDEYVHRWLSTQGSRHDTHNHGKDRATVDADQRRGSRYQGCEKERGSEARSQSGPQKRRRMDGRRDLVRLHPADHTLDQVIDPGYPNETADLRFPDRGVTQVQSAVKHERARPKAQYRGNHIDDAVPRPANEEVNQNHPAGGCTTFHTASKRSRPHTVQDDVEAEEQDPSLKYSRKPRHKTRSDKYDYKGEEEELKRKSKRVKGKAQHRSSRMKSRALLNDEYQAPNVEPERLTLTNSGLGMFARGKSSAPMARRDLPDLTFSEMTFLHKRRELDDARFRALQDRSKPKKTVKGSAQDVSHYFADPEHASVRHKRSDSVSHSHRLRSPDTNTSLSHRKQMAKGDASKATLRPPNVISSSEDHVDNHAGPNSQPKRLPRHHPHSDVDGFYVYWSKSPERVLESDKERSSRNAVEYGLPASAQMHRGPSGEATVHPQSSISNEKPQDVHQGSARQAERAVTRLLESNPEPQRTLYCLADLQRLAEKLETQDDFESKAQDSHVQIQGKRHVVRSLVSEEELRSATKRFERPLSRGKSRNSGRAPQVDRLGDGHHHHHSSASHQTQQIGSVFPDMSRYSLEMEEMNAQVDPAAIPASPGYLKHDEILYEPIPDPAIRKQINTHSAYHEVPSARNDLLHGNKLPAFDMHHGSSHAKLDFIDLPPSSSARLDPHYRTRDTGLRLHADDKGLDDFDTALLLSDECHQAGLGRAEEDHDLSDQEPSRDQMIETDISEFQNLQDRWITDKGIEVDMGEECFTRPQLLRPSAESASELKPFAGFSRPCILH